MHCYSAKLSTSSCISTGTAVPFLIAKGNTIKAKSAEYDIVVLTAFLFTLIPSFPFPWPDRRPVACISRASNKTSLKIEIGFAIKCLEWL